MIRLIYITVQLYFTTIKHQLANPTFRSSAIAWILLLLGLIGIVEEALTILFFVVKRLLFIPLVLLVAVAFLQWLAGDYEQEGDEQEWSQRGVEMMVGTWVDEDII